jgi:hypothetical protein
MGAHGAGGDEAVDAGGGGFEHYAEVEGGEVRGSDGADATSDYSSNGSRRVPLYFSRASLPESFWYDTRSRGAVVCQ